jgi:hypothetical protein
MTATEQETDPTTDVVRHWPPVAHIIRKDDEPAREGTAALCGEKLMGIDLRDDVRKASCEKCREIMAAELARMNQ